MIVPTIHLNGTSAEALIEDLSDAFDALGTAYDKLKRTAPNARDYYPQGPDAYAKALMAHLDRLKRVDQVRDELQLFMLKIADA